MTKKCLFNNLFVSGFKHESPFALGYMSLESLYICKSLPILFCPAFFFFFYFLAVLRSVQNLSSPSRDGLCVPCGGIVVSSTGPPRKTLVQLFWSIIDCTCLSTQFDVLAYANTVKPSAQSRKWTDPFCLFLFWYNSRFTEFVCF